MGKDHGEDLIMKIRQFFATILIILIIIGMVLIAGSVLYSLATSFKEMILVRKISLI